MRELPTNICPLVAIAQIGNTYGLATCIKERCAFWDYTCDECALVSAAISIREVAENLADLAKLQEKTARVATNNTDGKGGTDLISPVSASHDTKEPEDLQGGISK